MKERWCDHCPPSFCRSDRMKCQAGSRSMKDSQYSWAQKQEKKRNQCFSAWHLGFRCGTTVISTWIFSSLKIVPHLLLPLALVTKAIVYFTDGKEAGRSCSHGAEARRGGTEWCVNEQGRGWLAQLLTLDLSSPWHLSELWSVSSGTSMLIQTCVSIGTVVNN